MAGQIMSIFQISLQRRVNRLLTLRNFILGKDKVYRMCFLIMSTEREKTWATEVKYMYYVI